MGHIVDFGYIDDKKVEVAVLKNGGFVAAVSTFGSTILWYGTKDRNYVTYHNQPWTTKMILHIWVRQ